MRQRAIAGACTEAGSPARLNWEKGSGLKSEARRYGLVILPFLVFFPYNEERCIMNGASQRAIDTPFRPSLSADAKRAPQSYR